MATGYKTGGRQKGSLNKRTLDKMAQEARAALGDKKTLNGDSYTYLVDLLKDPSTPPALGVQVARTLLPFQHSPKPEQHQHNVLVMTDAQLKAIAAPALKVIEGEVAE